MSGPGSTPLRSSDDVAPSSLPQTLPPAPDIGRGHSEYHFVVGLSEVNKTLGEITASIAHLTKTIDSMQTKLECLGDINASIVSLNKTVDSTKSKVDDLIQWKSKILGGAMVLGGTLALVGFIVTKFSSYVTIKTPETQLAPASQLAPTPQPSTVPAHSQAPS